MAPASRRELAEKLSKARAGLRAGCSQRQMAAQLKVARSTLQDWHNRPAPQQAPAALAAFIETPEGVEWLHRPVQIFALPEQFPIARLALISISANPFVK